MWVERGINCLREQMNMRPFAVIGAHCYRLHISVAKCAYMYLNFFKVKNPVIHMSPDVAYPSFLQLFFR